MSLAVAALRMSTVKALDARTSAAARVYDSVVDPRDLMGEEAKPAIVVYADTGKLNIQGRDIIGAPQTVELTVDLFVARAVIAAAGTDDEVVTFEFAAADAALDTYLRCLSYEVVKVLLAGDNQWSAFWRDFFARASASELSEWMRGAEASKGARFAFLRTVYRIEVIDDPTPGKELPDLWSRFFDALDADGEFGSLGSYMRALVTQPQVPAWRAAQTEIGLADAVPAMAGFGDAVVPLDGSEPAVTSEIDVEDKDTAETVIGDASTAETVEPPPP